MEANVKRTLRNQGVLFSWIWCSTTNLNQNALFKGASLVRTDLEATRICSAILEGAQLQDALMMDADLTKTNICKADLTGTN